MEITPEPSTGRSVRTALLVACLVALAALAVAQQFQIGDLRSRVDEATGASSVQSEVDGLDAEIVRVRADLEAVREDLENLSDRERATNETLAGLVVDLSDRLEVLER